MMRQITNYGLILFLLINANLFSQPIVEIQITGNKVFSENNYLTWLKISPGTKYFPAIKDSIKVRISSAMKELGYFNSSLEKVEFDKIDSSKIKLAIDIKEGNQTIIGTVLFSKAPKDSARISGIISQLHNSPFTKANVEFIFSQALDYYENNGYPFASVNIQSVEFNKDSTKESYLADLILSVDEGVKSRIDKIEISGNERTKDYVIARTIQIFNGEDYSQKLIDGIPERLNRLRFFEPVEQPSFYFNSKREGVLKITVKEKQTNNFDGIIGYVPAATDQGSGFFTGYINISLRNLFGTGRAALFRWQQESLASQELELRYIEPWLFGLPFNIEAGLLQRKQDSTYVQRNLDGKLEYQATQEISASIILSSQSTIPTQLQSGVFTVFNSSAFTTGINLKIDTRDDFYAPTKGIYFNNTFSYSSKKINGPANFLTPDIKTEISFQRLEFDFSIFKEFFARQIAALGIHGRELRGSDTEISDLYFVGGTNSLRGYREKQFLGNRILWSNLEYRFLLSRRSYTFIFFDSGYFLRNENIQNNIPESSAIKLGYGFGLNIETSLGVLGISFALGKGDTFSQGKIHFGIINEF
jgi:outer membrane protein insertion porin family